MENKVVKLSKLSRNVDLPPFTSGTKARYNKPPKAERVVRKGDTLRPDSQMVCWRPEPSSMNESLQTGVVSYLHS